MLCPGFQPTHLCPRIHSSCLLSRLFLSLLPKDSCSLTGAFSPQVAPLVALNSATWLPLSLALFSPSANVPRDAAVVLRIPKFALSCTLALSLPEFRVPGEAFSHLWPGSESTSGRPALTANGPSLLVFILFYWDQSAVLLIGLRQALM